MQPDREATCAWDCQLDYPHDGPCSTIKPVIEHDSGVFNPLPVIAEDDDCLEAQDSSTLIPPAAPDRSELPSQWLRAVLDEWIRANACPHYGEDGGLCPACRDRVIAAVAELYAELSSLRAALASHQQENERLKHELTGARNADGQPQR